jgi:hypothetical protein
MEACVAIYTANNPVKTLTIHRPGCSAIKRRVPPGCGCGVKGATHGQKWWCENHITRKDVDRFMGGRFWAILLCDVCFKGN